ncbi:hypothetical protein ACWEOH_09385 [Agromyces sp. NPDC004153]
MNARTAAPVIAIASLVVLMSGCAGVAAQGGQVRDDLRPAANAAAVIGLGRGEVIVRDDLSPTRVENRITARMAEQAAQAPREFSADALRELHSQPVVQGPVEFSADARRELHSQPVLQQSAREFSADARRELHSQAVTVEQKPFSADARRELHSQAVTVEQKPFSADVVRELKGSTQSGVSAADMQGTRLSEYAEAHAAADVTAAEMQGQRLSAYGQARSDAAIRELKGSAPVVVQDDVSPTQGSDLAPTPTPQGDTVDDDLSPIGGRF